MKRVFIIGQLFFMDCGCDSVVYTFGMLFAYRRTLQNINHLKYYNHDQTNEFTEDLPYERDRDSCVGKREPRGTARRVPQHHGTLRMREVHFVEYHGPAGLTYLRNGRDQRRSEEETLR